MIRISEHWRRWKVWILSVAAGTVLGCVYRLFIDFKVLNSDLNSPAWIMTIAFLVFVPLCMGYLSVHSYLRALPPEDIRWFKWLLLPWASVLLTMLVSVLVKWEGFICLVFAGPIMLFFSLWGGIAARLAWGKLKQRSPGTLSAFALPLLLMIVETQIPASQEIRTVNTEILIHAPASAVWSNIKSVRAIEPNELPVSWVGRVGFPSPIAATLSREGIGGVREATFTGGLIFTETINRWDPEEDLRFSIRANAKSIPRSTLDEHVTIGGAFFDVLDGEYRLEQRPEGILLHLASRERLSTHFNFYAGGWTDAVMEAIQKQILAVIRGRCESQTQMGL
jgi:hypothetical protein